MDNFPTIAVASVLTSRRLFGHATIASIAVVIIALLIAVLMEQFGYLKSFAFLIGAIGLFFLFIHPEYGLVFSFSSAIFKEWLSLNVPLFAQFDYTIAVFLLTFVSIFFFLIKKNWLFDVHLPAAGLPLLLFTGFMIFSITYSPSFKYGSFKSFSFLFFNWALFLFPVLIIRSEKAAMKLVIGLFALAVPVAIFTIFTLIKSILAKSIIFTYRSSFLGVNPISYANWIGAIATIWIVLMPIIKNKIWRIFSYVGLLLLIATMFAANSRGPMMSFIIAMMILVIIRYRGKSKRNLIVWGIVVIAVIGLLLAILPEQVTSRYTDVIFRESGRKNLTFFTVYTRLFSWKAAWEMATDSWAHMMFGVGSGGYSQTILRQDIRWYPHNMFLEVFCELGLIGTVLLCWHFLAVALVGLKAYGKSLSAQKRALLLAFMLAAVFNFIGAQFSGDLNDNRRLWFFLGLITSFASVINNPERAITDGSHS